MSKLMVNTKLILSMIAVAVIIQTPFQAVAGDPEFAAFAPQLAVLFGFTPNERACQAKTAQLHAQWWQKYGHMRAINNAGLSQLEEMSLSLTDYMAQVAQKAAEWLKPALGKPEQFQSSSQPCRSGKECDGKVKDLIAKHEIPGPKFGILGPVADGQFLAVYYLHIAMTHDGDHPNRFHLTPSVEIFFEKPESESSFLKLNGSSDKIAQVIVKNNTFLKGGRTGFGASLLRNEYNLAAVANLEKLAELYQEHMLRDLENAKLRLRTSLPTQNAYVEKGLKAARLECLESSLAHGDTKVEDYRGAAQPRGDAPTSVPASASSAQIITGQVNAH